MSDRSTTRLAYRVDGPADGPALLLGPSLGTTVDVWAAPVGALARHRRVVRFDLPGHGASAPPAGPVSMADLAAMVTEIADAVGATRFDYAGLSIGGMIGMALPPARLDRLVLVCTSAHLPPADGWRDRAAVVRAEGAGAVADAVVARWFTAGFRRDRPAEVARWRAMIAASDPAGYAACCEAIAAMDRRAALPSIAAPTLVVAGRDDPATPPAHAETIARGVRDARLVVLDNAAHLATVERAAEVTALMTGFLEER